MSVIFWVGGWAMARPAAAARMLRVRFIVLRLWVSRLRAYATDRIKVEAASRPAADLAASEVGLLAFPVHGELPAEDRRSDRRASHPDSDLADSAAGPHQWLLPELPPLRDCRATPADRHLCPIRELPTRRACWPGRVSRTTTPRRRQPRSPAAPPAAISGAIARAASAPRHVRRRAIRWPAVRGLPGRARVSAAEAAEWARQASGPRPVAWGALAGWSATAHPTP